MNIEQTHNQIQSGDMNLRSEKILPGNLVGDYALGPFQLELEEDSGIISKFRIDAGIYKRNILECICAVPAPMSCAYFQRIDPLSGIHYVVAASLAMEGIVSLDVPERAIHIRMVLMELERVRNHLNCLEKVAGILGHFPSKNYLMREKERISDVFEIFCGSRMGFGAVCLGGVASDATDGWLFRVEKAISAVELAMQELRIVLLDNPVYQMRFRNLLPISATVALLNGLSGPNARAGGIACDLRRDEPYLIYSQVMGKIGPTGGIHSGDGGARIEVRVSEISDSIQLVKALIQGLPKGNFVVFH